MTAEDARRNVSTLSQLLRDEVAEAMREPASRDAGSGDVGPREAGSREAGSRGPAGASERPVWLSAGEQQLARAARASRPDLGVSEQLRAVFSGGPALSARPVRLRAGLLAALVVGGVGLGAGLVTLRDAADGPALTFQVQADSPHQGDGSSARHAGRVIAPADRAEEVRFSDGSRFTLTAGSMLRVRETDAHGAMVIVEEGQVESSVQHRGKARWSVFAGPYEVRVVGTRFRTAWDPGRQRLSVVLHEGTVQVLGKGIEEVVELKPGQRFESGGTEGTWFVTATAGAAGTSAAAAPSGALPPETTPSRGASDQAAPASDAALTQGRVGGAQLGTAEGSATAGGATAQRSAGLGPSWSTLVASGKFEEVLDEASVRGEASCLSSCSVADLRALADAARYTGRFSLAERTLSRLRTTAPSEGPRAGFLLGSMNEAQGRPAAALEWYGRYLLEAPSGGLAAEARAGRMRALLALGQTEAAKAAARDYLRLHPAGVGAEAARQILLRP